MERIFVAAILCGEVSVSRDKESLEEWLGDSGA